MDIEFLLEAHDSQEKVVGEAKAGEPVNPATEYMEMVAAFFSANDFDVVDVGDAHIGAMNAETGQAEQGKCIACLGCLANCPDNALRINDLSLFWSMEMEMEGITEESLKEKKSKIYL